MNSPFSGAKSLQFAVTGAAQSLTIPTGFNSMVVSNPITTDDVWFTASGTAAVTAGATFGAGGVAHRATVQVFSIPNTGGTLSLIATGAGGTITITLGDGA